MGRKTNSAGEVMFKKPGRMRWDYEKPDKSSYITDGGVLWLYEPDDKQAFKQKLESSQLPAALSFLTGKGKLATEFDITFAGKTALRRAPGELRAVAVAEDAAGAGEDASCSSSIRAPSTCARASSPTRRGTSTTSCSPTSA